MLPTKAEHLRALYRIAKNPHRGVLPFFRDPRNMIALRNRVVAINEPAPEAPSKAPKKGRTQ